MHAECQLSKNVTCHVTQSIAVACPDVCCHWAAFRGPCNELPGYTIALLVLAPQKPASRRVARTIFFGSAPTLNAPTDKRGIDEAQIKLGVVQPGEQVSIFGDALRRLNDQATYLFAQGGRYWFSTVASVNRLAADRAALYRDEDVLEAIEKQLKREAGQRGDFDKVHVCPTTSAEIPDDREAKLVILRQHDPFVAREERSRARQVAEQYLEQRANGPRRYRNTLVFLAADGTRLNDLKQAMREYLAWASIAADGEARGRNDLPLLNLDAYQMRQALDRRNAAIETVRIRIPETYSRLLVPGQDEPTGPMSWREITLQGTEPLAVRASKKLRFEELLMADLGGVRLRLELDRVSLWRGDSVSIKQLAEDFAQYLYLPRLKDEQVLLNAITGGVSAITWQTETFAYAEGYDDVRERYLGLLAGWQVFPSIGGGGLVVKPAVAAKQLAADEAERAQAQTLSVGQSDGGDVPGQAAPGTPASEKRINDRTTAHATGALPPAPAVGPRRFYGSMRLDPQRAMRDATTTIQEVVQHLTGLLNSRIELTLEISAEIPDGAPDYVVRTVTENCRTLKFTSYGFEDD
jgi:hypothetical protein